MNDNHSLLFVDDDSDGLLALTRSLKASGISETMHCATSAAKGIELAKEVAPSVAVCDLSLDEVQGVHSGYGLIKGILEVAPMCRVIVLTGHGDIKYGVRALELGAANFLAKPANISHLAALVRDGIFQVEIRQALFDFRLIQNREMTKTYVGSSASSTEVVSSLAFAATTPQSILIKGETGTGKGLCARLIHKLSARSSEPFIRYQPTFSNPDLVNSELFGHSKGSFTGAEIEREGLLAAVGAGTLFLDEISELPSETQVSLLGVLQEKVFRPVGANNEIETRFRLISATNADLEQRVDTGQYRSDLFHRLAHQVIELPALRDRLEDIEELAITILNGIGEREEIAVQSIGDCALLSLMQHSWPGNVRELQAVIESAAYRAQFKGRLSILREDLPSMSSSAPRACSFSDQVEAFKLSLVQQTLRKCGGNQSRAAKELRVDRSTFRRILMRSEEGLNLFSDQSPVSRIEAGVVNYNV